MGVENLDYGCSDGRNCYIFDSDWVAWEIVWPDDDGCYDVITPEWEQFSWVSPDGNWCKDWDVFNVPWFSEVLKKISGRKKMVISYNMKCAKRLLIDTLGGVNIQTKIVNGKEYSYSTWQDLWYQLKEDGVSVEEIWKICKEIDPNIGYTKFFHTATWWWGFVGLDLFPLQRDVLGKEEEDSNNKRPWFYY